MVGDTVVITRLRGDVLLRAIISSVSSQIDVGFLAHDVSKDPDVVLAEQFAKLGL
jgi:hypothetical protein